jgi:hypothetical protein
MTNVSVTGPENDGPIRVSRKGEYRVVEETGKLEGDLALAVNDLAYA